MSWCRELRYSLVHNCLPLLAPRRQQSLLSGTLVVIAGHTSLAALQAMQVDENGGWVDLKAYDCNWTENETHDLAWM